MTEHLIMIIAPGEDVDRNWVPEGAGSAWCWMPRPTPLVTWSLPGDLGWVMADVDHRPEQALPQHWSSPSWSIDLWFYVWSRLIVRGGVKLPMGYVMPGHVVGRVLESECIACHKRRWHEWPICVDHPDA